VVTNVVTIRVRATLKVRHGGGKRLSLIQMMLLRHLKAEFGVPASHVIFCDYVNVV